MGCRKAKCIARERQRKGDAGETGADGRNAGETSGGAWMAKRHLYLSCVTGAIPERLRSGADKFRSPRDPARRRSGSRLLDSS